MTYIHIRPDAKGRVTLGKLAKGISSFRVSKDKKNRIVLEPMVEIPERERWVHEDPKLMKRLKKSLQQSARGETYYLGDFSKYIDD